MHYRAAKVDFLLMQQGIAIEIYSHRAIHHLQVNFHFSFVIQACICDLIDHDFKKFILDLKEIDTRCVIGNVYLILALV